ncbi:MAG: hypothetical protein Q8L84_14650 [Hyphomonas sp.]|nr:hypothetical protein [Hyphomonas sp.]
MIRPYVYMCAGLTLAALGPTAAAQAADVDGEPIIELRLRTEFVDQAGLDETTALTLRGRFGYEIKMSRGWSALAEAEAIGHLNQEFSDTVRSVPGKAVVPDPETFELNRLQVGWKGDAANATLGRQRIIFDDARFVGNVGFRQNEQTFDALRIGYEGFQSATVDYVYIDKVHRIFGDDSPVGEFQSDSHVVRLGAQTGLGDFAATALLLDFDNATAASSQTYSMRWSDKWETAAGSFGLTALAARQSEYNGNGPAEDLGFQSYGATLARGNYSAFVNLDVLEGSAGQGFATPLATLHAFQGWADVFLNTPATGVRDLSLGLRGKGFEIIENTKPASWALIYHDFDSDNGAVSYGGELDAVFTLPINDWLTLEAKGAVFDGVAGGPAGRTKFWLALDANL